MQYLANAGGQAQRMPGVPVRHIPHFNPDTAVSSSGTLSTPWTQRKVQSPYLTAYHAAGKIVSPNRFTGPANFDLTSKQRLAWNSKTRELQDDAEGPVPGLQLSSSVHESISADSEHDLAQMVHDYMENGNHGIDSHGTGDEEQSAQIDLEHSETLQGLVSRSTILEKELLSALTMVTLSADKADLICQKPATPAATSSKCCNGSCIRWLLVKRLQLLGYDAGVCSVKWPSSRKVPGGEYEYIDLIFDNNSRFSCDRIIVDIDFRSQFQIARATQSYVAVLRSLPTIFVGSLAKLSQILHLMAKAIKMSLKQNGMPVPPWRTLNYLISKWMSPGARLSNTLETGGSLRDWHTRPKECVAQLHSMKSCMSSNLMFGLCCNSDSVMVRSSSSVSQEESSDEAVVGTKSFLFSQVL